MVTALRRRKRVLIALNVLLVVWLTAIGLALVLTPADNLSDRPKNINRKTAEHSQIPDLSTPPLSAYVDICKRPLRKPLFDPKPIDIVQAKKTAPPKPRLTVTLVGTVLEPGFTYAMLRGKSEQMKFIGIGQSLDDAEVTAITARSVTLKFHGDSITLRIDAGESR